MQQSASAPVSKAKQDIASSHDSLYRHFKVQGDEPAYGASNYSNLPNHKPHRISKRKENTIWSKMQQLFKTVPRFGWAGAFVVVAIYCWVHILEKKERWQIRSVNLEGSTQQSQLSLIPKAVRCGNTNKLGSFEPPSWFDFLFSTSCPSTPSLSLFRLGDDDWRLTKKHEWRSTNNNLAIEFMFSKRERIHSILLMMPSTQREVYIQAGAQFRLLAQHENPNGMVTKLIDTVIEEGFYERAKRFDSISFSCMSSSYSFSKFRVEIESKKTVHHVISKLVIL